MPSTLPMSRGVRGRAELPPVPPCARLGSMCTPMPPAMPSDIAPESRGDACGGLTSNLLVVVLPLSAVDFERGGCGVLIVVEYAGADAGVIGEAGEMGYELGYELIGVP